MACVTGAGAETGAATTGDAATLTGPAPAPDDVVIANELLAAAAARVFAAEAARAASVRWSAASTAVSCASTRALMAP